VNRVVGNLIVEEDPVFGGGHLSVSGEPRSRCSHALVAVVDGARVAPGVAVRA
jgi:hypothetical protein